jgi:hypothetical protein
MSAKQRLIVIVLFFLLGGACLAVGLYFGAMYGSNFYNATVLSSVYDDHKEIYKCGVEGNVNCFKESFRDMALVQGTMAGSLAEEPLPHELAKKMKEIEAWYKQIGSGLRRP